MGLKITLSQKANGSLNGTIINFASSVAFSKEISSVTLNIAKARMSAKVSLVEGSEERHLPRMKISCWKCPYRTISLNSNDNDFIALEPSTRDLRCPFSLHSADRNKLYSCDVNL